jgi:hypothetical protein
MNKVIQLGGSAAFIPTFKNAAYGIEWTKDDNDIIRIGSPRGTVVRSSWLINLFSVFAFLNTTPITVYYNIKYNKLKT